MARPACKIVTADEAAGRIPDGAVVTVSSSLALGCPDKVLAAIGARFDREGHPKGLTTIMRPWASFTLAEHNVEKIVARRAAMGMRAGQTANLGFGICSMVPRILLEEGQAQSMTWAIGQGGAGGRPLMGFAFMPSPTQFTHFQGGGFDVSLLSFLGIDVEGNVKVSKLGKPYLTAGCGGFVDITAQVKKLVFAGFFEAGAEFEPTEDALRVVQPGRFGKQVEQVEHATFSGRRERAQGQGILYVTERCVIRRTADGLTAVKVTPGIDQRDIVDATDGRGRLANDPKVTPRAILSQGPRGRAA